LSEANLLSEYTVGFEAVQDSSTWDEYLRLTFELIERTLLPLADFRSTQYDALQKERDALQKDRDTLQKERDALQKDRDTLQKECDTLRLELDGSKDRLERRKRKHREQIAEKEKAMGHLTSTVNNLLLQNRRSPVLQLTSPAQLFQNIFLQSKNVRRDLELRIPPSGANIDENEVNALVGSTYKAELAMYDPTVAIMTRYLGRTRSEQHPGIRVVDTHALKFLDGHAPDISICIDSSGTSVCAETTYVVVELKLGPLDDSGRGQACGYLQSLRAVHHHRKKHIVVLSNLRESIVLAYSGQMRLSYRPVGFIDLLRYLRDEVLNQPTFFPLVSQFSYDLGGLEEYLGRAYASQVASFRLPRTIPNEKGDRVICSEMPPKVKFMAVKRVTDVPHGYHESETEVTLSTEIDFLVRLNNSNSGRPFDNHLQKILFHSLDKKELATLPVGSSPTNSLVARALTPDDMSTVLLDILDAIIWLHQHNIIHRDIRWDNVIVSKNRGFLIDLGSATAAGEAATFAGGWVCCPPELLAGGLNGETEYTPLFEHDFLSWVLMVNMSLFPERWDGVGTDSIVRGDNPRNQDFERFWKDIEDNRFWGPYVKAAKQQPADVEMLRKLPSVYYWIVNSC
jgi:hypothetical protein